ncbi:MAG: protein kinase [Planctomycetes bacterium]|nr:protein kinase [Planctomycetota bacterium]
MTDEISGSAFDRVRDALRGPAWPTPRPDDLLFGRYRWQALLGHGAVGAVYKALDIRLNRVVALKVLAKDFAEDVAARFLREAQLMANLQHPNIVPVYDVASEDGVHYFTMKCIEGGTLASALAGGKLDLRRRIETLETVARAVHAAHQANVIHRDLKPANILLDANGTPHIGDFGLAHVTRESTSVLTREGSLLGTAAYMSPEQASGHAETLGAQSDVHALGVILYEMLTGRVPFLGADFATTLYAILTEPPKPPRRISPKTPADLEKVALKALEKHPRNRYTGAQDFADDLRRWLNGEPVRAAAPSLWRRLKPRSRRALTILLAAALALGAYWARPKRPAEPAVGWTFDMGGELDGRTLLHEGHLYFHAQDEMLYCVRAETGACLWSAGTGNGKTVPCAAQGKIFFNDGDQNVTVFSPLSPEPVWKGKPDFLSGMTTWRGSIAHDAGRFYFTTHSGRVACASYPWTLSWMQEIGERVPVAPLVHEGRVFLITVAGSVCCFDATRGTPLWKARRPDVKQTRLAVVVASDRAIAVFEDGEVWGFDTNTGAFVWKSPGGMAMRFDPAELPDAVVTKGEGDKVVCLEAADGARRWESSLPSEPTQVGVGEGLVVVSTQDGALHALDSSTGRPRWRIALETAATSPPIVAPGWVYVGCGTRYYGVRTP